MAGHGTCKFVLAEFAKFAHGAGSCQKNMELLFVHHQNWKNIFYDGFPSSRSRRAAHHLAAADDGLALQYTHRFLFGSVSECHAVGTVFAESCRAVYFVVGIRFRSSFVRNYLPFFRRLCSRFERKKEMS